MKHNISKALLLSGCALLAASCDENSWNDHELPGFEVPEVTDVQVVEYTLTEADYSAIASNSANKALAGDALASALKAVGTNQYFNDKITAREYVPAFLASTAFEYFTLTDGSAVKLTYRTAVDMPEEVTAGATALAYTVTDEDYQSVWESTEDYTASFTPSHAASRSLPGILKSALPGAKAGEYAVVTYNVSTQEPVFKPVEAPEFTPTAVVAGLTTGETATVSGYVTAIGTQGYVLTDASGSIFVYYGSNFDATPYALGDEMTVTAEVGAYRTGLQLKGDITETKIGSGEYTYPAPTVLDGAALDAIASRTADAVAEYVKVTGTAIASPVTDKETGAVKYYNYNLKVDGAKAMGSAYIAPAAVTEKWTDGAEITVEGYVFNVPSTGKYVNIIVTSISSASKAAASVASAPIESRSVDVVSQVENAMYVFDGSKWSVASGFVILNPADYAEMGQRYNNLQDDQPATFLPIFLTKKYPYAQVDEVRFVVYKYYSGSTSTRCDAYTYSGSEWVLNTGIVTESAQFVRNGGKWMYDPNVTITLPAGKGVEISTLYYQACVDWVAANIDAKTGAKYVTSYGNNEYYSGASAYQGNVDLRASSAIAQYAAGYEGMSNDAIVALMKKRFVEEVLPAALSALHPEAAPVPGLDVIYTINFSAYNGSSTTAYVAKYKVTAPGKFEFMECSW